MLYEGAEVHLDQCFTADDADDREVRCVLSRHSSSSIFVNDWALYNATGLHNK